MAEGARFELADPLRGLQFSRLARSAAPSPLRIELAAPGALSILAQQARVYHVLFFVNALTPAHIGAQDFGDRDATIRVLIVFEDGDEGAADGKP